MIWLLCFTVILTGVTWITLVSLVMQCAGYTCVNDMFKRSWTSKDTITAVGFTGSEHHCLNVTNGQERRTQTHPTRCLSSVSFPQPQSPTLKRDAHFKLENSSNTIRISKMRYKVLILILLLPQDPSALPAPLSQQTTLLGTGGWTALRLGMKLIRIVIFFNYQ